MDQQPFHKGSHRQLYLEAQGQPHSSGHQCGHRRKTSPAALQSLSLVPWGQRCHLHCSIDMTVVSLAQVAGCIRAVKEHLVQLWLLFTTSLLEVITISDLLTELLMGLLPKPFLSRDVVLAKNPRTWLFTQISFKLFGILCRQPYHEQI